MDIATFPYRPQLRPLLMACLFFGGGGIFMAHQAATNDRGLVIDALIHLGRDSATLFYWGVAAVSGIFVLLGLATLAAGLSTTRVITLTEEGITAPRSVFARGLSTIRFSEVRNLALRQVRQQRFLSIRHGAGTLSIPASSLPDGATFDQLCALVSDRVRAVRS